MDSPRIASSLQVLVMVSLCALLFSATALAETIHVSQLAREVGVASRAQDPTGSASAAGSGSWPTKRPLPQSRDIAQNPR